MGKLLNVDEKDNGLLVTGSILAGDIIGSFIVNKAFVNFDAELKTNCSDLYISKVLPLATRVYAPMYVVSNTYFFTEALVAGYHGYTRNYDSLGYGLAWGLLGQSADIRLALAQGYAKPLKK